MQEVRHPDFEGLHLVPDPIGGAEIVQNCDLYKRAQLDSRHGYRHANHRRYNGGVVAIINIQRICDYGKILVCSGWTPEDFIEVFEHEEGMAPGWGGPVGTPPDAGDPFWDKGFPPVAVALADPTVGNPPLIVQFNGENSFDPQGGELTYEWDFGDGTPLSNEVNPQHIYNGNVLRTATLTVTNPAGRTADAVVQIDTTDTIVVTDFDNAQYSFDGGVNLQPVVGVPANNQRFVLGANGFVFIFRANGANVDVYRSDDGANYALVGTFAGGLGAAAPFLGHNNRILIPIAIAPGVTGIAYSDDNGATWIVVTVVAGAGPGGAACRMTNAGQLMYTRQVLGANEFYLSVNNGAAWALTAGSFGNGSTMSIVGGEANRVIAEGRVAGFTGEIRTSDDQGATWQLRQATPGTDARGIWSGGNDAIVEDAGFPNPPWLSANNGLTWANFVGWGAADMMQMIERPDGYFAAVSNGIWFAAALPNFVLRGGGGTWWYGIATLRDQET